MKKEYLTENKKTVLDFFKKNDNRHFTIDNVCSELSSNGSDIPKSSLYRIVSNLWRAGTLKRFEADGIDSFVYQYANFTSSCDLHFHLKCKNCGKLMHLECEHMNELREHIMSEHGFLIGGDGIINGICEECKNNEYGAERHA